MSQIAYNSGGPWGVGDGFIPLDNHTITQTMYLAATNSLGVPATRCKVWFAGNGVDAYIVQSSILQQGAHTVTVTVNGQSSGFMIPAYGRWSDYVSTTSFTLPGNVNFISVVKLKIPILIPITGGGDDTQTGPSAPGVVSILDNDSSESIYVENCETVSGTDYDIFVDVALDTINKKFGDASWNFSGQTGPYIKKTFTPTNGDAITFHGWINYDQASGIDYGHRSGDPIALQGSNFFSFSVYGGSGSIGMSAGQYYTSADYPADSSRRLRFTAYMYNKSSFSMPDSPFPAELLFNGWNHFAFVGKNIGGINKGRFYINGQVIYEITIDAADPFKGIHHFLLSDTYPGGPESWDLYLNLDALEVCSEALWWENFTPPNSPPPSSYVISTTISVTSTGTITVSDNTLVDAGDTITITETNPTTNQTDITVYTFAVIPTGAPNEIIIGTTAAMTAANIAEVIGETVGAEFTATSSNSVVTWINTTADTVTISDTSDGITVGTVTQTITYTSSTASSTIPSFTASGSAGANFGGMMAPLTATGEATMSGNNASIMMPAFTSTGMVYQESVNYYSSDAAKIALLLCGDAWMADLAAMIAVPGDYDDVALVCTQWVANNITYTPDTTLDDWNDARHTAILGTGDCEDGAILLYSLIRNSGIPHTRVRVYIGETNGNGHAWVMYQRDHDNQWIVLDWTDGSTYWNAVSSVQDLTELYDSIRTIVDSILSEEMGVEEAGFYSDNYPYGEAWEYFNCADLVTMGTPGEGASEIYAKSLYSDTGIGVMVAAIPAIRGGLTHIDAFGWIDQVVGFGGGSAALTIPTVKLVSTGKADVIGTFARSIPNIHLSATGHVNPFGNLAKAIPSVELSAHAWISTREGNLQEPIPAIRLTASASYRTDKTGTFDNAIPAIRISSTGFISPTAALNQSIPMVRLTASGIAGIIGNLSQPIPSATLSASAWWLGGANLSMAIPSVRLTSHARAAEIVALALNTKNFGLTKYTNYDYNSLCMFNGKLIGTKRTGIYELEGADDDGTAIPWKLRTGKVDLKTSKLRHVWLSGTVSGDIKLIVETADGDRYEYDAEPVSESEDEIRVKVGKGLSSKYVIIELQNESDQTITLDKMQIYGMRGER
jgi:predicted transglutaminase-like cysteine proteinase